MYTYLNMNIYTNVSLHMSIVSETLRLGEANLYNGENDDDDGDDKMMMMMMMMMVVMMTTTMMMIMMMIMMIR
jgi:hypothetical protein